MKKRMAAGKSQSIKELNIVNVEQNISCTVSLNIDILWKEKTQLFETKEPLLS